MAFHSLMTSRRFWLAVAGVGQALTLHYLHVPDDVWVAITALIMAMIGALTVDDAAATAAGVHYLTGDLTDAGRAKLAATQAPPK